MARHAVVEDLIAAAPAVTDPKSLIGLIQAFRPGGLPEIDSLLALPGGPEFAGRLQEAFDAVASSARPDSMKDAYFVIRNPPLVDTATLAGHANRFIASVAAVAQAMEGSSVQFADLPDVRILEGKPPKHPRAASEKSELLNVFQTGVPAFIDGRFAHAGASDSRVVGRQLAEALYFVACDSWLREYLRLPLLGGLSDPADQASAAYFQLWRHGVKYRIFSNHRVDFYLPRRADGTLIDAGQFANR